MKLYADKTRKVKSSEIQVGDAVLLKQRKQTNSHADLILYHSVSQG